MGLALAYHYYVYEIHHVIICGCSSHIHYLLQHFAVSHHNSFITFFFQWTFWVVPTLGLVQKYGVINVVVYMALSNMYMFMQEMD